MSDKINLDAVDFDAPLPDDRTPYIPITSAKVGGSITVLLVSSKLFKVNTHYVHGRTKPCTLQKDAKGKLISRCEGCELSLAKRWKGYFGGWLAGPCRYTLVEITTQAAEDNRAVLFDPDMDFRGKEIILTRVGKKVNAPVKIEFRAGRTKKEDVPAEFDVRKALCRVWEKSYKEQQAAEAAEVNSEDN